jgi:hypothetical protein
VTFLRPLRPRKRTAPTCARWTLAKDPTKPPV